MKEMIHLNGKILQECKILFLIKSNPICNSMNYFNNVKGIPNLNSMNYFDNVTGIQNPLLNTMNSFDNVNLNLLKSYDPKVIHNSILT